MRKGTNIVLWGHTASGKTSVGVCLSKMLGLGFLDIDQRIEREQKKTVAEIFQAQGEDFFRGRETRLIEGLGFCRNHVISVGGGALEWKSNLQALLDLGFCVWLNPPEKVLTRRLLSFSQEIRKRPILLRELDLSGREKPSEKDLEGLLARMLDVRRNNYSKAHFQVRGSFETTETISQLVSSEWRRWLKNKRA